jgi:hypothetical protein
VTGESTLITLGCGAERGLERLEPLQLHGQAGVEREGAGSGGLAVVEEGGVEGGGAADGEVGAAAEAAVVSKERRDERQAKAFSCDKKKGLSFPSNLPGNNKRIAPGRTDEVDDEAAVAVAPGGAAEEGGAVGRARHRVGDGVPVEHDGVVAGVGEGVAETEDGVVAPPHAEAGRHHRRLIRPPEEEYEERDGSARQQGGLVVDHGASDNYNKIAATVLGEAWCIN